MVLVPGGQGTRREVDNPVLIDWLRKIAPALQLGDQRVHGRAAAVRGGPGARPARDHALGVRRGAAPALPGRRGAASTCATCATATWSRRPASRPASTWRSGSCGQLWGVETARKTQRAMEYDPAPPVRGRRLRPDYHWGRLLHLGGCARPISGALGPGPAEDPHSATRSARRAVALVTAILAFALAAPAAADRYDPQKCGTPGAHRRVRRCIRSACCSIC